MSVTAAVGLLLLLAVLVDLTLTAGIIRRLRLDSAARGDKSISKPREGHRIDLTRDAHQWPSAMHTLLHEVALVAFVLPGCSACQRLRREIDLAGDLPVPFYVFGDPVAADPDVTKEYLRSWGDIASILMAPDSFELLDSFARPDSFPTLVLLNVGTVAASGHRLDDVAMMAYRLGSRVAAG